MDDPSSSSKSAVLQRYVPWLLSPFTAPPDKIDGKRSLWKPIKVSGTDGQEYFFLYDDNIFLGSCWGVLSGYTSDAFFKPAPKLIRPALKSNIFLTTIIAARVTSRMTLSALLYQAVERKAAEYLDLGMRSSTTSNFAGLTALAVVFRVSNRISESAFISAFIFGGYLIGSKVAREIHRYSLGTRREREKERSKKD